MVEELDPTSSAAVSRRYRELSAEEPPRELDDAILAAARRSAQPWAKRWAVPLSLAAVIVLSVTVTLRIQHEQPGIESPVSQAPSPARAKEAATEFAKEAVIANRKKDQAAPATPVAAVAPAVAPALPQPFATNQAAGAASRSDDSRAAVSSVTGERVRQMEERASRDAEAGARAPRLGVFQAQAGRAESSAPAEIAKSAEAQAVPQAQKQAESPERELERIAQLRAQGRHDEADRALAEFRKRYPDYKIPEAMRERIERRQ